MRKRGRAAHLPRRRSRRRQDVRDARRGAPPAANAAPTWWPRCVETHGRKQTAELLDGIEIIPPRYIDYRGSQFTETGRRRRAGPRARGGAGRRAGPHQHPRQQEPQALAGRRGAARRRHHRDHDGQRPAPGEPQRRRRADHRHRAAGDGARRGRPRAPTRSSWSTSPRRRCGAGWPTATSTQPEQVDAALSQLLPARQPDRAARARAAVAGRPGRRRAGRSTAPSTRSPTPGRPASASSSPSPAARSRRRWCAGRPASRRSPAPN